MGGIVFTAKGLLYLRKYGSGTDRLYFSRIFFAVIIMSNCKKPLESALKTFAFFLISQPLIYLLQVPFSPMGWGLFSYYPYWFYWTLATFPMAFVGWFIQKKNWLSVLIFSPVFLFSGTQSFLTEKKPLSIFPICSLRLYSAFFRSCCIRMSSSRKSRRKRSALRFPWS